MTRVLVIGANGMLGHMLMRSKAEGFEIAGTLRTPEGTSPPCLSGSTLFYGIDCRDSSTLEAALEAFKPDVVINAAGIIKQRRQDNEKQLMISVNALFPHLLSGLCKTRGIRLVHISTDCVFSGHKGDPYTEQDIADASDVYGLTKYLGEVHGDHCLTLRCSMIGRELAGRHGLLEWAISQRGTRIQGYDLALYTGLTTQELARAIFHVIRQPSVHGLYHVAGPAISKYHLLEMINQTLRLDLAIERDTTFRCDRRLDGAAFSRASGYHAPAWQDMLQHLREDACLYE